MEAKKGLRWFTRPLAFSLICCLFSCATTPETHRSQLILIDQGQEMRMGAAAYRENLKKARLSSDGELTHAVRVVGAEVARAAHKPDYPWEFNLIEEESPNAYCLPGGKVAVHTGILPIAQNEAGLAAVIGHEVAHAIARHGAERMSHSLLIGLAGELLAQGLTKRESNRVAFRAAYGTGAAIMVQLPFSRSHEMEADHMGLLYMARAGYDPREAEKFWIRFAAYARSRGKTPPPFLSTHPAGQERIAQIRQLMQRAMIEYDKAPIKHGVGKNLL